MHVSRIPLLCLSMLLALTACGNQEDAPGSSGENVPEKAAIEGAANAEATEAPERQGVSLKFIPEGPTPDGISIQVDRNIFESVWNSGSYRASDGVAAPDGTTFEIQPEIPGRLTVTSAASLAFEPDGYFEPDVEYRLSITGLSDGQNTKYAPQAGENWSTTFRSPRFAYLSSSISRVEADRGRIMVDMAFTHPISPAEVKKRARWKLGKRGISKVRYESSSMGARHVLVTLEDNRFKKTQGILRMDLDTGVPMANRSDLVAASGSFEQKLTYGQPWRIKNVTRLESGAGHYLQVVCDDDGHNSDKRYWWSSEIGDSFRISGECSVDEREVESQLRIEPKIPFYVAKAPHGFRIFGEFERGTYQVRFPANMRSTLGSVLTSTHDEKVRIPPLSSVISFKESGRYLPKDAWNSLAITHRNIESVRVSIRHIPPENITFWLSDYNEAAGERNSETVAVKTVPVSYVADEMQTTWLDMKSLVPNPAQGVYEVSLWAGDKRAVSRLLMTDISLVAKNQLSNTDDNGSQRLWVWSMHSTTLEGLSGTEIRAVKPSGKVVGQCKTGTDGGCVLNLKSGDHYTAHPLALLAQRDEDFTYLRFQDLKTDTSNFEISGESGLQGRKYRASLFSDRGIYRPGDTFHLSAILRDLEYGAPQANMPVKLNLIDPRSRRLRSLQLKTNGAGMITTSFTLEDYAATGFYNAQLLIADTVIQTLRLNVEEFVPERMKVEVNAEESDYLTTVAPRFEISAEYLFGGTANGNQVEMTCEVESTVFKPKGFEAYDFSVQQDPESTSTILTLGTVTGRLDETGKTTLACPLAREGISIKGATRVRARVAVFEGGSGRTTKGVGHSRMHPAPYYIGLKSKVKKAKAQTPIPIEGVVVDWKGQVQSTLTQLNVDYIRVDREYNYDYWGSGSRYHHRMVPEGRGTVKVSGGKFTLTAQPGSNGFAYIVRVAASADIFTDLRLEGSRYRYYWWSGDDTENTPKPERATELTLTASGTGLVGTPILVHFKSPFKGRALMSAEADGVLKSEWIDVEAGENSWAYAPETFTPNVYLSAFAVKDPHLQSEAVYAPERAFGVISYRLKPVDYDLNLTVKAPEVVRSNSALTVDIQANTDGEEAYVVVAAVDEGILSLTNFQSPDPFEQLFAKRALGVETYETIGWSLMVPPGSPSKVHGGGAEGPASRVQPVKPVALWSGMVKIPKSGKTQVKFDIPQYRGKLRVMAVAASTDRIGHGDAAVTVRDPVILQTTLPRFLTYGDEIQIPVFLTNMSGKTQDITLELSSEVMGDQPNQGPFDGVAPLTFIGRNRGKITLENGASQTAVFHARANLQVGGATLKVQAKSNAGVFFDSLDVPFLPQAPRTRQSQVVELEDGVIDLKPLVAGYLPTTEKSTFWVSSNPYGAAFNHMDYLLRYPYGCIEQTTSSTRPLLYVRSLLQSVSPDALEKAKVEDMIDHGIKRIRSMAVANGGFAYWPGGYKAHPWGTAYATHFLMEAKGANYPVPQSVIDDALEALDEMVAQVDDGRDYESRSLRQAEAYMLYVLAKGGKGNLANLQRKVKRLSSKSAGQSEDAYLLKAAVYHLGDRRYEGELKSAKVSIAEDSKGRYTHFYSGLRHQALTLSVFQDLFGQDPVAESLARGVARQLSAKNSRWFNTQELAWGVSALGRWLGVNDGQFEVDSLKANGKEIRPQAKAKGDKSSDQSFFLARASEYGRLKLDVDIDRGAKAYLLVSSEGIRENAQYDYNGKGLRVTRTYYDADGAEIDPTTSKLELGDLIFAQVRVENTSNYPLHDMALVDRLPAGWEFESSLLTDLLPAWSEGTSLLSPEYFNLRDDRVEIFGSLGSGEKRQVIYQMRAVTAGVFALPPVEVESMYDPTIWDRERGGRVTILGPWAAHIL